MNTELFTVDIKGMGEEARRRGLFALLFELWSNAVDEDGVHFVSMTIRDTDKRGMYEIRVQDDAPNGFQRLSDAYTMYAPSKKRGNAEKRGMFNIGEKYVIAACVASGGSVDIISTTGWLKFDVAGRHVIGQRHKRNSGTVFTGTLRTNRQEVNEALEMMARVIVPDHIDATLNGETLIHRTPLTSFEATLPTWIEGDDGSMSRTARKTRVTLYEPLPNAPAMLFDQGVPVVETGDQLDVCVWQRVLLSQTRDNVTPGYLTQIRSLVLNAAVAADAITDTEQANAVWVRQAAGDERTSDEAIHKIMDLRFGAKRVSYDPSDPEANLRAVHDGYKVVYGPNLSGDEWANVRRAGAIQPAGQVTPGHNPPPPGDGPPYRLVPPEQYAPGMAAIVEHARRMAQALLGYDISVRVIIEPIRRRDMGAEFGGGRLTFNVGTLGYKWFERDISDPAVNDLLIHELAHHYGSHLSKQYDDALSDLGARMVKLALEHPALFRAAEVAVA